MSDRNPRSGCAVALGVFLILLGSLLLAANLFDLSSRRIWSEFFQGFSMYWPLLLVAWGAYKITQRLIAPARARVGAGEVFLLIVLVLAGLGASLVRGAMEALSSPGSAAGLFDFIDPARVPEPIYSFQEELRFDLPQGKRLSVSNRYGSIRLRGYDGNVMRVVVTKRVAAQSEQSAVDRAARALLELDDTPQGARLDVTYPGGDDFDLDLEIWVSLMTPVVLASERGAVEVADIAASVGVATSYHRIDVERVEGPVVIEGNHSEIRVNRVAGEARLSNRHGDLFVTRVTGDVIVDAAHGTVLVEDMSGSLRVSSQHGAVRVLGISKDLNVTGVHTEVSAERVGGGVVVDTSYRATFLVDVFGNATIRSRNGSVEVRRVGGNLDIEGSYRGMNVSEIRGVARLDTRHAPVWIENVSGDLSVRSSYDPVEIRGFARSLRVESEHASVSVSTPGLGGDVSVKTSHGDVTLSLPSESSLRLDARASGGTVRSDFLPAEAMPERSSEGAVQTAVTEGEHSVVIETTYGDVMVLKGKKP